MENYFAKTLNPITRLGSELKVGPFNLQNYICNKKPLLLLYMLNLLDLIFTFAGLKLMLIEEANPLMAYFYAVSPLTFIFVKIAAVFIGITLISVIYHKTWVKRATFGLNLVYLFIFGLHIRNTILVLIYM